MKRLKKKQIGRVAYAVLRQLALTTTVNTVYSWGIINKVATQIKINVDGVEQNMAALMMDVNGFNYKGKLYITMNRAKQTFNLYGEQHGILLEKKKDVSYNDLGRVLDAVIETGGLSQEEHYIKLQEYTKRLLA